MRVFCDFGYEHPLTKMIRPYLLNKGILLTPHSFADCSLHYSHVQYTVNTPMPKVLRLDGCYYDITPGQKAPSNRAIKESYLKSDWVIYQSKYSKQLCEAILQPDKIVNSDIIYNAGGFLRTLEPHEGINIVCCSKWRRWKRLKEMVEIFKQLPFECTLHVVGPTESIVAPNIKYYGMMSHKDMGELYKKMDVALHLAKRDACPNSVVEFISAGIPVVVSDKGGGAVELAQMSDNCVIAKGDYDPGEVNPVEQYSEAWNVIPKAFAENVIEAVTDIVTNGKKTILPSVLEPEHCASRYADIFLRRW